MADTGSKSSKDTVEKAFDDKEVIQLIMDAYNVSFLHAVILWSKALETIEKAKLISDLLSKSEE